MVGCLERICCFLKNHDDDDQDPRPAIFVITDPSDDSTIVDDKESIPDTDSGVHSSSSKIKDCLDGSVSEEDSGVGSEGKESDVAEQTDTASNDDTDSLKPVHRSCSHSSKENFSDFELPIDRDTDLTAEIALQLKEMNGFSLEETSNRRYTLYETVDAAAGNGEKAKKKRKRRKHRKTVAPASQSVNVNSDSSSNSPAPSCKSVKAPESDEKIV